MRKAMLSEAPELIPVCVFAMRRFWRERDHRHEPYRASPKLGRNTPCPCGSGRKYKRCCGAN
ncbi:MAG: SEC-C domain-containing protein [Acetobacteraceae bacterium]|nr:SEC-C domain-containing protein [Acetobacteraceae bacterium]